MLHNRGAQAVILGCTEIEVFIKQEENPNVVLIKSAKCHIDAIVDVLTNKTTIESYQPKWSIKYIN